MQVAALVASLACKQIASRRRETTAEDVRESQVRGAKEGKRGSSPSVRATRRLLS